MGKPKKNLNLTTLLIIVLIIAIIVIAVTFLLTDDDSKIYCLISSSNTLPTNEKVKLKVYARGENAIIKTEDNVNTNKTYYEVEVDSNRKYTFYAIDGKNIKSCSINVDNIDKEPPTGQITASTQNKSSVVTLTITGKDNKGLSSKPYSWDNKTWSTTNTLSVTKNGTYKGYIKDSAGNIITLSYKVSNIGSNNNSNSNGSTTTEKINLAVNGSKTLTVAGSVKTWQSNNTSVASVNDNGKVTAKTAGTATITATLTNGDIYEFIIVVTQMKVTSITLNKTSTQIDVNTTINLSIASISPSGASCGNISWNSSNTSVATVSGGVVKGISAGTATITANCDGVKANAQVTVKSVSTPVVSGFKKYTNGTKVYEADSNTLKVYITKDTNGFIVTSIWASDPRTQLKKAITTSSTQPKKILEQNINGTLTSKIAIGFNASAISSHNDFYKTYSDSKYVEATPLMIQNGVVKYNLMKNFSNKEWPYSLPVSYINKSNNLVYFHPPNLKTADALLNAYNTAISEAYNTMTFGPSLVENGVSQAAILNYSWDASRYRQVICQVDNHNYRLITSNTGKLRLNDLADLVAKTYGCKNAMNLDGGGSVALLYKKVGENTFNYINSSPNTNGGYRSNKSMMYFTE